MGLVHGTLGTSVRRQMLVGLVVFGAVIASFLATVSPADAATKTTRTLQYNALGVVDGCSGGVCTTVEIELLNPGKTGGPILCLVVTTVEENGDELYEEGCADVTGTLAFDTKRQTGARVGPVAVDLSKTVCEGKSCDFVFSRTVTFTATWTGNADRVRVTEQLRFEQPTCTEITTIKGWARDARISASLDGTALSGRGNVQSLDSVRRCR